MTALNKLTSTDDSFTVNIYDNGFMIEVTGRDENEDWATQKIVCNTAEELVAIVNEVINMERA